MLNPNKDWFPDLHSLRMKHCCGPSYVPLLAELRLISPWSSADIIPRGIDAKLKNFSNIVYLVHTSDVFVFAIQDCLRTVTEVFVPMFV